MNELYKNHIANVISHWYKIPISEYPDIDEFLVDIIETLLVDNEFMNWTDEIVYISENLPIEIKYINRTCKNDKVSFSVRYFFCTDGDKRKTLSFGTYNNIFDAYDMKTYVDIYVSQFRRNKINFQQLKDITNAYSKDVKKRRIFKQGFNAGYTQALDDFLE